jgi:hypothetical protein
MVFPVKSTDEIAFFEDKTGYGVRIIDAKYPMPDEDVTGIRLGSPQYPAEHGDLAIMFTEISGMTAPAHCLWSKEYILTPFGRSEGYFCHIFTRVCEGVL